MNKFNIGDRVVVFKIEIEEEKDCLTLIGKIVHNRYENISGVEFNKRVKFGNNCFGRGRQGYCKFFYNKQLKLTGETFKVDESAALEFLK